MASRADIASQSEPAQAEPREPGFAQDADRVIAMIDSDAVEEVNSLNENMDAGRSACRFRTHSLDSARRSTATRTRLPTLWGSATG